MTATTSKIATKKTLHLRRIAEVMSGKKPWKSEKERNDYFKEGAKLEREGLRYFEKHHKVKVEFT